MTDSSQVDTTTKKHDASAPKSGPRIPLHDPVLTLFADGCHAANIVAGCVRLDLFVEHAWPGAKSTQLMVSGRLVMPVERLETFARGVNALVKKLKDDKAARSK